VSTDGPRVEGDATPEEIAAVLAALRLRRPTPDRGARFEQWRRQRLAVLRENG
jgi:anthranilate phosphoribosyltransferase